MVIMDIRPSEGTVSSLREMSQEESATQQKVGGKHRKKHGSVIDAEKYALRVLSNGCIADTVTAVDVTGRFSGPVAACSPQSEG
jgi:hypothetical protein